MDPEAVAKFEANKSGCHPQGVSLAESAGDIERKARVLYESHLEAAVQFSKAGRPDYAENEVHEATGVMELFTELTGKTHWTQP